MSQTFPAPIGLLEGLSPGTASPYAPFLAWTRRHEMEELQAMFAQEEAVVG